MPFMANKEEAGGDKSYVGVKHWLLYVSKTKKYEERWLTKHFTNMFIQ